MAETARARARAPPHHRSLPEEITIWEILVRLPPKSLLRCRAVCRATSTRYFLLANHSHQPSLPLLYGYDDANGLSLDVIPFDYRAGVIATDRLQSVARLGDPSFGPSASCDGLLVLSMSNAHLVLCNPATHQYACLPMLSGFVPLGMYLHSPTGEYRLLLYWDQNWRYENDAPDGYYVFALGSSEPPRHIGFPDAGKQIYAPGSVLFNGSLHWHAPGKGSMIIAFDTTAESFRQMRSPVVSGRANLFEMDGMLGLSCFSDAATTFDIWMAQDYESEVWAIKYRVQLPVAELNAQFGKFYKDCSLVVASSSDVLVLVKFGDWLLEVDVDGKLVASFHRRGLGPTQNRLKQTLVQHTFFPTLEGYLVNASPFIWPEDYVVNT